MRSKRGRGALCDEFSPVRTLQVQIDLPRFDPGMWERKTEMRGPKLSYQVALTPASAEQLHRLVSAPTTGQRLARCAQIVLLADTHPLWRNQQMAHAVGTSDRLVRTWRQRWVATQS